MLPGTASEKLLTHFQGLLVALPLDVTQDMLWNLVDVSEGELAEQLVSDRHTKGQQQG